MAYYQLHQANDKDLRKGEVGVFHAVLTVFRRQTEVPMKGILRVKVDAPMLEERIELLLCRPKVYFLRSS